MSDEHTIRSRADELLAEMTTAEKAGQLTQYFYFGFEREPGRRRDAGSGSQSEAVEAALARGEVGSLLFVTDPAEINRLQRLAVEGNRLGIPALFGFDVIHGLRTILPVPIALAASWDPATIERGQAVAAREARAVGIHWAFAPMVDIARDPRWGRIIEGAGEDPFLGAAVAAAQVRGFQGGGRTERVIAGPKHFAGYGAALGGRDYDEANISDSELWNVYFPPFAAAHRGRRRQRHDRLHGPQRHPGDRQPLAVHRGPARDLGLRGLRGQRRQRRAQPRDARLRRRPDRRRRAGPATPAATWRWRSPTRPTRTCRRRSSRARSARRRSTRASGGCSRPSSALGLFDAAVRRRGARAGGAGRPRPPRGGPRRGRALGGAAAQRG